jgi:hypothetical protein
LALFPQYLFAYYLQEGWQFCLGFLEENIRRKLTEITPPEAEAWVHENEQLLNCVP